MTVNGVLNTGADDEPIELYGDQDSKVLIDKNGNVYVRLTGNLVLLV